MDTSPVVENDLPCAICGYNLKGLTEDANCPECGQSVSRTFSPDITKSDPAWLRRQSLTMFFLLALELLGIVGYGSGYASGPLAMRIIYNMIVCLAITIGVFRLSAPEVPVAVSGATFDPWRRGIRAAVVLVFAIRILSYLPTSMDGRSWLDDRFWQMLIIVGVVAILALHFLVGRYLYQLAKRFGDRVLTAHARVIFWALPLQFAVFFAFNFVLIKWEFPEIRYYISTLISWANTAVDLLYFILLGRMHEKLRFAAIKASEKSST
jgi:hypothetical protein